MTTANSPCTPKLSHQGLSPLTLAAFLAAWGPTGISTNPVDFRCPRHSLLRAQDKQAAQWIPARPPTLRDFAPCSPGLGLNMEPLSIFTATPVGVSVHTLRNWGAEAKERRLRPQVSGQCPRRLLGLALASPLRPGAQQGPPLGPGPG